MFVINNIRTATQLEARERWCLLLMYAFRKYDAVKTMFLPESRGAADDSVSDIASPKAT